MTSPSAIRTEALTKRYGSARGIVDVSLDVHAGEIFGFLGPNGAGKTTLIRTLLDLLRPSSGSATVLGLDARRDAVAIHRRVGYLPGDYRTYRNLTGREYLRYFADLRGGSGAERIDELGERFEVDLSVKTSSLSHGNEQKLGLIQAFMHDPELLILDEPTSGLDPLMQLEFHTLVSEVVTEGRTVFLSSHVLSEVERMCDRVGFVREGRLVAVEDVDEVKARAARSFELRFASEVPAEAFAGIDGVQRLEIDGDVVRGSVTGSVDALVKAAARYEVVDLVSRRPDLEELFLGFYGPDGQEPE
jgi:ABC-2 type transport system ATP-binding protein